MTTRKLLPFPATICVRLLPPHRLQARVYPSRIHAEAYVRTQLFFFLSQTLGDLKNVKQFPSSH